MRNQKLRNIRPVEWCVHAQPEVAPYPPIWGLLTVNDVTRRASPGKYGSGNPFGCVYRFLALVICPLENTEEKKVEM
jgi:hypothetical protein